MDILAERKRLKWTRAKLAHVAGVHVQTIYNIETGHYCNVRTFEKIKKALKPVTEIVETTETIDDTDLITNIKALKKIIKQFMTVTFCNVLEIKFKSIEMAFFTYEKLLKWNTANEFKLDITRTLTIIEVRR